MKIIAESAFNHNGSIEMLKELSKVAKKSGADFFTVQVMVVDSFCVEDYERYDIYKATEFSKTQWIELFDFCASIQMPVIPCVLDEKALEICHEYGFELIKVHATDITNYSLLSKIRDHGLEVLLETQCATLFEINFAVNILGKEKIKSLFTGFSNYPTEVEELNLDSINSLKTEFSLPVSFADHSTDTSSIPLMVLAKNCMFLEKHITITRNNRNYDWQVSLYPEEFAVMANNIRHYSKALGNGIKHPTGHEKGFRSVLYKKVVQGKVQQMRSDTGDSYIESEINSFPKDNVSVAIIARLKSKRLPRKVLREIEGYPLIKKLYDRVSKAQLVNSVKICTSYLPEDDELVSTADKFEMAHFRGHPQSVIDRMLMQAFTNQAGCIFRVTGDNPLTDPELMDKMVEFMLSKNLDYVKATNVPFGVSAELYSTSYLWKLYLDLENPFTSEYLTWYVLLDNHSKIGLVNVESDYDDIDLVNLSVDYQEDLDQVIKIFNKFSLSDMRSISLGELLGECNFLDRVDKNKEIKLPEGESIKLYEFLQLFNDKDNSINIKYHIK